MRAGQIVWYGAVMFENVWTFIANGWPLLIGVYAGAFAWGYRMAERKGMREMNAALTARTALHREHIGNIEKAFGIDASRVPARVFLNVRETEH